MTYAQRMWLLAVIVGGMIAVYLFTPETVRQSDLIKLMQPYP